jgi:death-on-curing protein
MYLEIDRDALLDALREELARSGGTFGIRDAGLLESALARPAQLAAYASPSPSIFQLAAAVAYGLVRNHPFLDGNKRAGFIACVMMLSINDRILDMPDELAIETFLGLAVGSVTEATLVRRLEEHCPNSTP